MYYLFKYIVVVKLTSTFLFQDLSGNQLKDISPLNSLTHLLTLKADRNLLYSAKLDEVSSNFFHTMRCNLILHVAVIDFSSCLLFCWFVYFVLLVTISTNCKFCQQQNNGYRRHKPSFVGTVEPVM